MFDGPRYHPLIICDTEGKEAAPMFFTNKESGVAETGSYLEEAIPGYYHLKYGNRKSAISSNTSIHCPSCGRPMKRITTNRDAHKGTVLFTCTACR
jgi:hypothetical protein